ncbi:hypothetical protein GCM10010245_30640 [Streptomyces spectabilis]|nr:hypothetical protein GCM10010245_30640 [Streptomyces spectabilis]
MARVEVLDDEDGHGQVLAQVAEEHAQGVDASGRRCDGHYDIRVLGSRLKGLMSRHGGEPSGPAKLRHGA